MVVMSREGNASLAGERKRKGWGDLGGLGRARKET